MKGAEMICQPRIESEPARPHGLGFPEEEDQEGACVEVLGLGPEVSPTWPAVRSVALFWADPIGIPCKNSYGSFEAKK